MSSDAPKPLSVAAVVMMRIYWREEHDEKQKIRSGQAITVRCYDWVLTLAAATHGSYLIDCLAAHSV